MKILKRALQMKDLYGTAVVLLVWYMLHITVKSNIIPGPYETFAAFFGLLQGDLPFHILASLFRIAVAVALSVIIGVPLGLWIGLKKKADEIVSPAIYILYPIPKIAFLPVFMVLFGLGNSSKIILIFTIIVFQLLLAARDGVKEIPRELFYSSWSMGLGQLQIYTELVLPAVLPKIISALRISIGISISVLFFSENFATTYGIGYFIMNSWAMVDYVSMFAGIVTLSIVGILIFKLIDYMERRLCPWIFIHEHAEE